MFLLFEDEFRAARSKLPGRKNPRGDLWAAIHHICKLQRHSAEGLKWWEHKLIPSWSETHIGANRESVSLRAHVITFYDMAGVAGPTKQMSTLLCVSLLSDPVLRGEIPLGKEFIDPETCSMQKAFKMIFGSKGGGFKGSSEISIISVAFLWNEQFANTSHLKKCEKNAMSKYFNFMQNKFRRLSLKKAQNLVFRSFSTQI